MHVALLVNIPFDEAVFWALCVLCRVAYVTCLVAARWWRRPKDRFSRRTAPGRTWPPGAPLPPRILMNSARRSVPSARYTQPARSPTKPSAGASAALSPRSGWPYHAPGSSREDLPALSLRPDAPAGVATHVEEVSMDDAEPHLLGCAVRTCETAHTRAVFGNLFSSIDSGRT